MNETRFTHTIAVRATAEQKTQIDAAAAAAGLPPATWLRLVVMAATGDSTLSEQLRRSRAANKRAKAPRTPR